MNEKSCQNQKLLRRLLSRVLNWNGISAIWTTEPYITPVREGLQNLSNTIGEERDISLHDGQCR